MARRSSAKERVIGTYVHVVFMLPSPSVDGLTLSTFSSHL